MGPEQPLPLPKGYRNAETYVNDLLHFVASSELLENLCGGVHILDFFTRSPDLYSRVIDPEWREWFDLHELEDVIYFILHEDVERLVGLQDLCSWRGQVSPPKSFLDFIVSVRRLLLRRDFNNSACDKIPRSVAVGMNPKKVHEVGHFAKYVDRLVSDVAQSSGQKLTQLVDFGAGQNYLGRTLASKPYSRYVIAVEGRSHNVTGARQMDVAARIAPKEIVMRNKKQFRGQLESPKRGIEENGDMVDKDQLLVPAQEPESSTSVRNSFFEPTEGAGSVLHVDKQLNNGDLSDVITSLQQSPQNANNNIDNKLSEQSLAVISLHSCGTLSHHGLRSLILNPSVRVVAIVGCCYNLLTERFKPTNPNTDLPKLRPARKPKPSEAADGTDFHGFPMSSRVLNHPSRRGTGIYLNITARMMAVQAPQNWGPEDSESFFTRHFYRALLQKIFLDRGIVQMPLQTGNSISDASDIVGGAAPDATSAYATQPIIIGSLRKACYHDFVSYVRGAMAKLKKDDEGGCFFKQMMGDIKDTEIISYAEQYKSRKKHLSIVWTLMAYVAGLIEAVIVVDRWLWLREQDTVRMSWVECVFEYAQSPRNMVVVGVKY